MRHQATIRLPAVVVVLALGAAQCALATPADQQILKNRLSFRYVANPNQDPPVDPEILNNESIIAGTFEGTFWTASGIAVLQNLVKALMADRAHGGDDALQEYTRLVTDLTRKPVLILLINDLQPLNATMTVGGRTVNVAAHHWGVWIGPGNRVWPSARHNSDDSPWAGQMSLGAHTFTNSSQWGGQGRKVNATFIHELTHTQDASHRRGHIFVVERRNYAYGPDNVHFTNEAVPNRAAVYSETIADAMAFLYSSDEEQEYFNWFADNGALRVEKTEPPASLRDFWLYNRLQEAGVAESSIRNAYSEATRARYAFYRIRDLPAEFIAHNEMIMALVLAEFTRHVGNPVLFDALGSANASLRNVSASGMAVLFEEMCRRAEQMPFGEGSGAHPELLPLAFADYFTAYRATSAADFNTIFESMMPRSRVAAYWAVRDQVRRDAPVSNPPVWTDLTNVAMALGVRESLLNP